MQLVRSTKDFFQKLTAFFVGNAGKTTSKRCCIKLSAREMSLIYLDKTATTLEVLHAETLQYEDWDSLTEALSKISKEYQLKFTPTYWVLSPEDYQLFLIESLPVAAEELKDALNWRIRSLITEPLNEMALDHFMLPAKKTSPDSPIIAAVVAKIIRLTAVTDVLKNGHLHTMVIDIPELALRNLAALYETDEKSTAFIYITGQNVILNITRQKTLYFTRRLALPSETAMSHYEQLALDILRYFDYFQSQWRHPSPSRIFVGTEKMDTTAIAQALSEHLLQTVQPFSLEPLALDAEVTTQLQNNYLLPLGGALRQEEDHAQTTN